jgi:hypothetical protein
MELVLATEYALSRSPQLAAARLLNFFVERQPPEAKGQAPLIGAPGILTLATLAASPHRGAWNFNGQAYFVAGQSLWRYPQGGTPVSVATGISGTGRVGMSDNGTQLCIVNGVNGWIYTVAGGLVQITAAAFYPARTVTFMDGYFVFEAVGTNEWFLSALYDGTTYNGLDFASAEGQPGFVTATIQNLQLLFIFATRHIEIWYDAGTADFPFQRYAGGILNYGCVSPYSIVKQDGAIFFLGADKVFYRLQANVPIRVSTHAIETAIDNAPSITDAFATTWTWQGHKFVSLTLPSAAQTFCFDISTGKWHERNSVDASFNDLGAWRPATVLEIYDIILFGDGLSGAIGQLDWSAYTEYGCPMMGLIDSANIKEERKRIFCSRLELEVQAGVGAANPPSNDPQIELQRSVDGGMTFGKTMLGRSMGQTGAYLTRLRWMRQGQGRQIMFRLTVTDPVPRTIIGASIDVSVGI